MSSTIITDEIRSKADEFYQGHEKCSEKSKFLLNEVGLPTGLLPLKDMIECGYIKETGFVWMKQKKKIEHKFEKIGKLVSYSELITAQIEQNKIKKLTGVKAKELLLWITINEICLEVPSTGKLKFQTPAGLFRLFPVSAFEEIVGEKKDAVITQEEEKEKEEEAEKKVVAGAGAGAATVVSVEVKEA
ncbi:uncharacterized protein LOC124931583 [Impatiens glandulifera]|uniref:uncharacterized protein LOC124931583 n=1 Tax=Impatiens glandulifera TaxID=253017 RepID=UPI001FB0F356|nr:uncharacterized protein LOC124931583 [Impatiens glandulifera]